MFLRRFFPFFLTVFILSVFSGRIFAQNTVSITGKVLTIEQSKPLEYVAVKLYSLPDSAFVKGSRIIYNSGVIADTALEPGETATYNFPVKIKNRRKAQYHTMDIHWNSTD